MGSIKLFKRTKQELVSAIQWNGKNIVEISQFVPQRFLEFKNNIIYITNFETKERYSSEFGDYIVKFSENSFKIISRKEFEEEYSDAVTVNNNKTLEKGEMYYKVDIVQAVKTDDNQFMVKDSTGFITVVDAKKFTNEYKRVNESFTPPESKEGK